MDREQGLDQNEGFPGEDGRGSDQGSPVNNSSLGVPFMAQRVKNLTLTL